MLHTQGGIWRGGSCSPPNILGFSVIKCPLAIRGAQHLFSTCPPNIFLPDTPLKLHVFKIFFNLAFVSQCLLVPCCEFEFKPFFKNKKW